MFFLFPCSLEITHHQNFSTGKAKLDAACDQEMKNTGGGQKTIVKKT